MLHKISHGGQIMPNCEFVTFISILACSIAKDKSPDELATLSAIFVQLGDTLATIATLNSNNNC